MFKSMKNPPCNPEMENFEKGLIGIIRNLKFKPRSAPKTKYMKDLETTINKLRNYRGILVHSDKTGNLYSMDEAEYSNLIMK